MVRDLPSLHPVNGRQKEGVGVDTWSAGVCNSTAEGRRLFLEALCINGTGPRRAWLVITIRWPPIYRAASLF